MDGGSKKETSASWLGDLDKVTGPLRREGVEQFKACLSASAQAISWAEVYSNEPNHSKITARTQCGQETGADLVLRNDEESYSIDIVRSKTTGPMNL